jgi:hypothetical protein
VANSPVLPWFKKKHVNWLCVDHTGLYFVNMFGYIQFCSEYHKKEMNHEKYLMVHAVKKEQIILLWKHIWDILQKDKIFYYFFVLLLPISGWTVMLFYMSVVIHSLFISKFKYSSQNIFPIFNYRNQDHILLTAIEGVSLTQYAKKKWTNKRYIQT